MAATRIQRQRGDYQERIAALVSQHERTLLRVARQCSLCHDDALDAYQRALEIYVRRVASVEPATEVAWLKVVVRHEAMAIRRSRTQLVAADDIDLDAVPHDAARSAEDRFAATERARQSAEALRALKPDEAKALVMKAHGLSYDEIAARYGWTYTKVNRAMTEGRRRFLETYEEIESGQRCSEFATTLEALAAGHATPRELVAIRPHLRHCAACRSTIRALHVSRLDRALLFLPLVAGRDRLSGLRHAAYDLLHRTNASDVTLNVHAMSASGGGRVATAAAVLGVCVGGAGVGTVCAVSGLLDSPPPKRAHIAAAPTATPTTAPRTQPAIATPDRPIRAAATPSASHARASSRSPAKSSSARGHRSARDPKAVAENEFGFEQTSSASAGPAPTARASAASTGSSSGRSAPSAAHAPAPPASDPAAAEFTP